MNLKTSRRTMVMLGVVGCFLLALSAAIGISSASSTILYVKPTAGGSGNCSDWPNACTLQTALGMAAGGDEIWVAQGTHKPTSGTDRTATFQLANGVEVYSGFVGTESSLEDRDWESNITVLSGDIDNNDITEPNGVITATTNITGTNSYHVVTGSGTDSSAILDGFTITGGNADGSYPDDVGGGMFNDGSTSPTLINPTLNNVSFSGNSAGWGGGMANVYSSPTLTNVTFSGNSARSSGGGMDNTGVSPTLINVTFTGNSAGWQGGGMNNYKSSPTLANVTFSANSADGASGMSNIDHSSPTLVNVTFSRNSANEYGGGMYNEYYSDPTLTNCILWGNTAPDGAQIHNADSAPTIRYSLVEGCGGSGPGWNPDLGIDGDGNIDADPQFVDAPNDNLRLQATSPAIDKGSNDALPADTLDLDGDGNTTEKLPFDLDGNPRIVCIVDMGAYEAKETTICTEKSYLPLLMKGYAP